MEIGGRGRGLVRTFGCATLLLFVLLVLVLPAPARAQKLGVSAYVLGVATQAGGSLFGPGGTSLLGRFRLMPVWTDGAVTVDLAYEHILTRTPVGGSITITSPGGAAGSSGDGDWLVLDGSIHRSDRTSWRHRFDRLSVGADLGAVSVTVGRQAISWATTLFLTPADPFSPFDPSDPFREYRGGVDALRVRVFPGPFSEIEIVVRPATTPTGTTLTALGRFQTSRGGWAFGAWAGAVHDDPAGALFASGALGATGLRGEAAVRRGGRHDSVLRAALGADRRFTVAARDLYALLEVQFDGFGAKRPADLIGVSSSSPYVRGEMQTLGRWTAAGQVTWQAHPLVGLESLALVNLEDGSALIGPAVSWSATSAASVRVGAFFGAGADALTPSPGAPPGLASEYGPIPFVAYASVSVFF